MDVGAWLSGLGLKKYAEAFADNGVDATLLPELTNDDLKDLGVVRLADRKRLLKAIAVLSEGDGRAEELQAQPEASMGERRQVTVLFADVSDFTRLSSELGAEETHALLNRYFETVDAIVDGYGGTVDKHMGDNLMAVFGAPVAHTDDPERAIRAAIDIHQAMTGLSDELGRDLAVHIGIASGQVVASGTGSDTHREYTVTGDTVNLASRLDDMAGAGETLISEAVRHAASNIATCSSRGPVSVKGFSGKIEVWAVQQLAPEPSSDRLSAFVDRRLELRQFATLVDEALELGTGHSLLVRGEPGIGKTRLIEEFARIAADKGFATHKALIFDFGVGKGRDAIRALVRSVLGIRPGSGRSNRQAAVEAAVRSGATEPDQRVFLNDLLDLPQPVALRSIHDAMDNNTRIHGTQMVVNRLVKHASEQCPVLVIVEDVHWADGPTLAHLGNLASTVAHCRAVLVMTSRVEGAPIDQEWHASLASNSLTTIDLGPLQDVDARKIADYLLEHTNPLVESCINKAEGNPLFLEQLLRNAEEGTGGDMPGSIRSLVQARMDRLRPLDKLALQTASVVGQRFTLPILRHLLNSHDYDCGKLVEHHLIRREYDDYLFAHALIQEGAYTTLLTARRKELHDRAAEWFSEESPDLKAEHLDRAENPAAVMAYLNAAENEATRYRYERSMELVRRGLKLAKDRGERYLLTCLKGDLRHEVGEIRASIDAFAEARNLAIDDLQVCRAEIGIAGAMRMIDDYDEAFAVLDRTEPLARSSGCNLQLARLHHLRGNLCFPLGQIERCWEEHNQALACARLAGSLEWEARALGGLADAEYARGRLLTAERYVDRCMKICRSEGFGRIEVANISILGGGGSRYYRGDLKGALEVSLEAEALARKVGHERAEVLAQVGCYISLVAMAEMDRASKHLDRAKELAEKLGARRFVARALQFEGRIDQWKGNTDAALIKFRQAMAISRETGIRYAGPAILADIALTTHDDVERRNSLEEGEYLLQGGCVSASYFEFFIGAMETSLQIRAWNRANYYAGALGDYTSKEPLPLTDFFINRGRALAAFGRDNHNNDATSQLQCLYDTADQMNLQTALPAIRAALK
ncbi:MAG: AAA family ATPase [Hyphomicrobiales bacterium]|nr:AAA family ATPase [Hyphomicrobiales bacterium]MCP5076317.1 AAA family ATPase [Paracoccaceae bacterium]